MMFIRPFPTSHAARRANRGSRVATLSSFLGAGTVTLLVIAGFARSMPAGVPRTPAAERMTPVVLPTVKVVAEPGNVIATR